MSLFLYQLDFEWVKKTSGGNLTIIDVFWPRTCHHVRYIMKQLYQLIISYELLDTCLYRIRANLFRTLQNA